MNETKCMNALRAYIEKTLDANETGTDELYKTIHDVFELSDDDIRDLGYHFIVPLKDDAPLESYEFDYTETYYKRFTVLAHDGEEAYDIFRNEIVPNIKTSDLICEDKCYFLH